MKRYYVIDWLKLIAAIGIVLMHIKANTSYSINYFMYDVVIGKMGDFVFLFMVLSGFGISYGYYNKFMSGMSPVEFYKKRYEKLFPFFALLVIIDIVVNYSQENLYEAFADLTMCFGLLPNAKMEVIGVGWNLGVIFCFYLLYPFVVFLMSSKTRGWIALVISIIFHYLCNIYFFDANHVVEGYWVKTNIVYCAMFFIAGAMIYRYLEDIERIKMPILVVSGVALILFEIIYYSGVIGSNYHCIFLLLKYSLVTIICIRIRIGKVNMIVNTLFQLSYELYLCHMFIFRIVERVGLLHVSCNDIVNYFLVSIMVICGSLIFAFSVKKVSAALLQRERVV